MAILSLYLKKPSDQKGFVEFLKQTAFHSLLKDQIDFTQSAEVVSSDIVGGRYAGVIDGQATKCDNRNAIIYLWYDNEIGYCAQLIKVVKRMAGIKYKKLPNFL